MWRAFSYDMRQNAGGKLLFWNDIERAPTGIGAFLLYGIEQQIIIWGIHYFSAVGLSRSIDLYDQP